jgi:hypothetical protein
MAKKTHEKMFNIPGHKGNANQKHVKSRAPVVYACNPSSSGGRDQEDCNAKSAQGNSSQDPILKNPSQK